jgi:hypothetical protein
MPTSLSHNSSLLSIIGAYISAKKGTNSGIHMVHSQQNLPMEKEEQKGSVEFQPHLAPGNRLLRL